MEIQKEYNKGNRIFTGIDLSGANLEAVYLQNAYLRGADLQNADLSHAYLGNVDLQNADLRGANLYGTNLENANLEAADLSGATIYDTYIKYTYLRGAKIQSIWDDLREVVIPNIHELPYLYKQLVKGKVDGSTYMGKCACLSGTLAHGERNDSALPQSIKDTRDAHRPIECFFLRIKPGDNLDNSWDVREVVERLETIAKEFNITLENND